MKYMQIRFTEFRDAPGLDAAPVSEVEVAQQKLAEIDARDRELKAGIAGTQDLLAIAANVDLRNRLNDQVTQADNVQTTRKAALAALDAAGQAAAAAMKSHAMVGKTGYQVIDDARMEVVKVVDESGADIPEGAVYGYAVVNAMPATPSWAKQLEAALEQQSIVKGAK